MTFVSFFIGGLDGVALITKEWTADISEFCWAQMAILIEAQQETIENNENVAKDADRELEAGFVSSLHIILCNVMPFTDSRSNLFPP
jgi:hypothetical protein